MSRIQYGLKKEEARETLPRINLILAPHEGKPTHFAIFGKDTYQNNLEAMSKRYFNSKEFPFVQFRPATTSETISAIAYGFGEEKEFDAKNILITNLIQMRCVQTEDGIYTNIENTDRAYLKNLLDYSQKNSQKINGIYLIHKNMAFIPYESFKQGMQELEQFVEGGLARGFEHTDKKIAYKFKKIASSYLGRVDVDFSSFSKCPIKKIVALGDWNFDGSLSVGGDDWLVDDVGYAFGVMKK